MTRDGHTSTFHDDGFGNVIALTDEIGNVTDTYAHTAFGELAERTGTTVNPLQWQGMNGYYTDEDGTLNVRRRQYNPVSARWLSADPLAFHVERLAKVLGVDHILDLNYYRYVWNRPLDRTDPSGLDFIATAHFHIRWTGAIGLTATPNAFHYSLEKWVCGCKETDPKVVGKYFELISRALGWQLPGAGTLPALYPEFFAGCERKEWVELSGYDWQVDVSVQTQFFHVPVGRVPVPIAVIYRNRPDHFPIDGVMPLFVGDHTKVDEKWNGVIEAAESYKFAVQGGTKIEVPPPLPLAHWPKSMYYAIGTNSNTFIWTIARLAGIPWKDMPVGLHPGDLTPKQNPINIPRTPIAYQGIEMVDDGSPVNVQKPTYPNL